MNEIPYFLVNKFLPLMISEDLIRTLFDESYVLWAFLGSFNVYFYTLMYTLRNIA